MDKDKRNFAMSDTDFWGRWPDHLRLMADVTEAVGLEGTAFVLGESNDEDAPAAAIMRMPPNYVLTRHSHSTERLEVIVAGSLDVGGGLVLGPGDVMQARASEPYGDHIAGPEGCTTVEIFGRLSGMHNLKFATPKGMLDVDLAAPGAVEAVLAQMTEGT
jgi:hypothetical protein